MFTQLLYTRNRNSTNMLNNCQGALTFREKGIGRINNAYRNYFFNHGQKILDIKVQVPGQRKNNEFLKNKKNDSWEENGKRDNQGWQVSSWALVILGSIITYLFANSKAHAEENEEESGLIQGPSKPILVTKENFKEINAQLTKDNPTIHILEFGFILTDENLQALNLVIQDNTELGYISWHKDQLPTNKILQKIETQLISNNKNYRYHPSDFVHGLLSKHAYKNSVLGDLVTVDLSFNVHNEQLKDWRVERVYDDTQNSGYYGVIYKNDKTHQVVLANRGTEEIIKGLLNKNSDWKTNFEEILGGNIVVGQQARNLQATEEAISIAKKAGYRLSFTGHSLGAWLAELSAFYSYAYFDYQNIKAVTFDSPGTVPMMEKLQSNIRNKNAHVKLENIPVVTYLAGPNPANCCNSHVGEVYRVHPTMKWTEQFENKIPDFIKNAVGDKMKAGLSIEGHFLSGILETFNPETGKPRECKKMLDWPRMEYNGDEKSFAHQGKEVLKEAIGKSSASPLAQKGANLTLDYIIGDRTLMTIIGFLKNVVKNEINQNQYWTYFTHIDLEKQGEENSEQKTQVSFDNRFTLITLAKYREGQDRHVMKLTTGSVDKYLYKLDEFKEKLKEDKDVLPMLKIQLEDLLANFTIERNGVQNILIPSPGCDVEGIRQRAQRLLQVIPKDIRKVWQKAAINQNQTIFNVVDGNVTITDQRVTQLPDNFSWQTTHYIGIRKKEQELEDSLSKNQVVVISGAGGMGKSTLAEKFGIDRKQEGWQVRWIKGTQLEEEFFQLARDLKIPTTNLHSEEIRNLVYGGLERLPKKQILLIFDNVEDEAKIKQYLKNLPIRTKVLITSRNGNLLKGIKPIQVNGFSKEEAISYLRKALEKKENEKEVEQLVEIVQVSPLRLDKVVTYLNRHPLISIEEFIIEYESIKKGRNQNAEIYPEVELLFRDLRKQSPESWRLLKYLAYLDAEGVPLELINNLMGKTRIELDKYVETLKGLSLMDLVIEEKQKLFRINNRIVQDETKKALIEEDKTQESQILEKLIKELDKIFPTVNNNPEHWREATEYISHAKILVEEAKKTNLPLTERQSLMSKVGDYNYYIKFNYSEAIDCWKELLEYERKIYQGNHPVIAKALDSLGLAYANLGGGKNVQQGLEHQEASLKMRQALFAGNHPDVATSCNNVGLTYMQLGGEENLQKGLKFQENALKMRQALFPGNHPDTANSLDSIGLAYAYLGGEKNIQQGLEHQEASLKMRQALFPGSHPDVAASLHNIGWTYKQLGGEENIQKGLKFQEEGLKMYQALFPGNHPDVATALNSCGNTCQELGGEENIQKGLQFYEEALKMHQALFPSSHPNVATALHNIGMVYKQLGGEENIQKGLKFQEEGLKMLQALFPGNHPDVANALNTVGYAYQNLGGEENIQKGLKFLEDGLKMSQALFPGNHPDVANALYTVGYAYQELGGEENIAKGLKLYEDGLKMSQALFPGNHPDVANALYTVGYAYQELGGEENIAKGLKFLEDALKMRQALFLGNHPDVATALNSIGLTYNQLGGEENIQKALQFHEDALKMFQALYPGDHPDVANLLHNVGYAYRDLGGEENIKKGLKFHEDALKMRQTLFPGNHPDVANSLNDVGAAYRGLVGEENIQKCLKFQEEGLKMLQALFPGNHPDVANALNTVGYAYQNLGGEENIQKGLKFQEDALKIFQALFPGNHPDVAIVLNNVGYAYQDLGGKENIQKGLKFREEGLKMHQALFPVNDSDVATSLNDVGAAYQGLGGKENIQKGLKFQEDALKMRQALFPENHSFVARSLNSVGIAYERLDDRNKALEYFKQAFAIVSNIPDENAETIRLEKLFKSNIELNQKDFFTKEETKPVLHKDCNGGNRVGPECRWIIISRGETTNDLITLKQKIQNPILNLVVKSVEKYGWSYDWLGSNWGVKGYIDKSYLNDKLGELGNKHENREVAQMLCFESMNLGIMKSENKPYEVVEEFTRDNPELVKKIAIEHPEFFVDGSIVEACVKAMPNDKAFAEHIFEHVKYMGMEERKAQQEAA